MQFLPANIITDLPAAVLVPVLGVILPLCAILAAFYLAKFLLRYLIRPLTGRATAFIADRYLFSRTHRNAINIITFVAVLGITYVTAALITVLAIFNGFTNLVENMYTAFDPDVRVVAARGKTFADDPDLKQIIRSTEGVAQVARTVQDKAMLTYFDKQFMVEVKGLEPDYLDINRLDSLVYEGEYDFLTDNGHPLAVVGGTVAYYINARISDRITPMELWAAGDIQRALNNPLDAARNQRIFTAGYFKVQMEYDQSYILADFDLVQDLFNLQGRVSSYDIKATNFDQAEEVAARLRERLDDGYKVQTWYILYESLFNVLKNE